MDGNIKGFVVVGFLWAALLSASSMAVEVKKEHPRVLLTKDDIPRLKKVLGPGGVLHERYSRVKGEAGGNAPLAALCHLVEGETGERDKYVETAAQLALSGKPDYYAALAYDWAYDALTPDERATIAKRLAGSSAVAGRISENVFSYGTSRNHAKMLVTLAIAGDIKDARVSKSLEELDAYLHRLLIPALNLFGACLPDSPDYQHVGYEKAVGEMLHAWQTATGEKVWEEVADSWARMPDWYLWAYDQYIAEDLTIERRIRGHGKALPREDDGKALGAPHWCAVPVGAFGPRSPVMQLYYHKKLGLLKGGECDLIQSFMKPTGPSGWGWADYRKWDTLAFYDPSIPVVDFNTLPTSNNLGGHVIMRSGWDKGATIAMFSYGDFFGNHQHLDAGSFHIHRKGILATDNTPYCMYQAARGGKGAGIGNAYSRRTVAHNSILIWQEGEEFIHPDWGYTNDGGQYNRPTAGLRGGRIWSTYYEPIPGTTRWKTDKVAYEFRDPYTYVWTDLTPLYSRSKCERAERSFVFVKPGIFVVFDRVRSVKAGQRKTWLCHFYNKPEVTGEGRLLEDKTGGNGTKAGIWKYTECELVTATDREGKLFVTPLLPERRVVHVVGGPKDEHTSEAKRFPGLKYWGGDPNGYEFWDRPVSAGGGRNRWFRIGTDADQWPLALYTGWGRMELEAAADAKEVLFLCVIEACDTAQAAPSPARLLRGAGTVGVEVNSKEAGRVTVTFSLSDPRKGHIRIVKDGRTVQDRDFTTKVEPNPPYFPRVKKAGPAATGRPRGG